MPFVCLFHTFDHLTRFYFNLTNETTLVNFRFRCTRTQSSIAKFCSNFMFHCNKKDFPICSRIPSIFVYSKTDYIRSFMSNDFSLLIATSSTEFSILNCIFVATLNLKSFVLNILKLVMWIWVCHYIKKVVIFCYMYRWVCLFLFMD